MSAAVAPETEAESGPGPMLRAAREARGLSEQQAAEQLNLDVTVVAALERDDFASLGAPVFAKGHLRRYGALLGLADDALLDAYDHARRQPEAPSLIPRSRQEMMPVREPPRWRWVIGGAVLFIVAAGLAAYLAEYGLRWPGAATSTPAAGAAAVPAPVSEAPVSMPAEPSRTEAESVTAASSGEEQVAPPPVPPGHVSLTLTFGTDSWAEIYDASGKAVLYDLGRAGTQRTIAAAAPLSVTFGNGTAVTLAVNGRSVAVPVPAGQTVARFTIETDGTLR